MDGEVHETTGARSQWTHDIDLLAQPSRPAAPEPNGHSRAWLLAGAAALFLAGVSTRFIGAGAEAAAPAPEPLPAASGPVAIASAVDVAGRVVVRRAATVSSAYTAQVKALNVREGDAVAAGQVLAELDSSEADAAVRSAEARVAQLGAARAQAEAAGRLRALQLSRARTLAERGYASAAVLDELKSAEAVAQAELRASKSGVAAAEADLRRARAVRERLVVRAPFAGLVSAVSAEVGEVVSPASNGGGFVRTGICTLLDLTSREIEVFVPERYLPRLRVGASADVSADAAPGLNVVAKVATIAPEVDAQRGAVKVTLRADGLDARLLPNMNINARLRLADSRGENAK